jgi:Rrp15p
LQKMARKEQQEQKQLNERRKQNRTKQTSALHVPLSVATSMQVNLADNNNKSIAQELEQERVFRKWATRGVVALFNAIAKHQKKAGDAHDDGAASQSKKTTESKKVSNQSFVEMIRSKALSRSVPSGDINITSTPASSSQPRWNALKDDYMLDSTKDWEEKSDEDEADNDKATSKKSKARPAKKARTKA